MVFDIFASLSAEPLSVSEFCGLAIAWHIAFRPVSSLRLICYI